MRKWRSFIQTRAAFERRSRSRAPREPLRPGSARSSVGAAQRQVEVAADHRVEHAGVARRGSGRARARCRRCRRGGRAAAGSPASARRSAPPPAGRDRKASSETQRRVGAGGAGDAAHELGLEPAEDARARARCAAPAAAPSRRSRARRRRGRRRPRRAPGRRAAARPGTKNGSVSACDRGRGARAASAAKAAAIGCAAEVGEPGELRRGRRACAGSGRRRASAGGARASRWAT